MRVGDICAIDLNPLMGDPGFACFPRKTSHYIRYQYMAFLPSKQLSLKSNFSWAFAGNVINAACQWGILATLAKLGSPEVVGLFALGLAVTLPIAAFTNLQLRGVFCTDTKNEYTFGDYLGLRILGIVTTVTVSSLVAFMFYESWQSTITIVVMSFAVGSQSLADIYYALFQKHERLDLSAKSMILKGVISLLIMMIIMLITSNLIWTICGLAASRLLLVILFDIRTSRFLCEKQERIVRFKIPHVKYLLWLSLPMGLNMMILSYSQNIPRYFLEVYSGEYVLGIFSALAYVMMAGTMITGALGQAALPRLAKYYAAQELSSFRKLLSKLLFVAVCLGFLAMGVAYVLGKPILALLYTPEYAHYHTEFMLVMLAGSLGLVGGFFGTGLTAARKFRSQPILNFMACLIALVVSFLLIPRFGLMGGALTVVASAFSATLLFGVCLLVVWRRR